MSDELEQNKLDGTEPEEVEIEEKPELPQEPVDRNEAIDVPVREQKKRNRFKEFEERATRAEKAAEEARREAQEARALHQQRLSHPQDQSYQPQQQIHPAAQRLKEIDEATRRLHKEYQAVAARPGFTEQQQDEYEQRALQLQTARMAAVVEATRQPVNEQEMYRRWKWNDFITRHSDVFSNEKAKYWAVSEWQKRVYALGEADTEDLAEKILDETRVKYGMKPRRGGGGGPDVATRARLSGVSAQGGGGGGGGDIGAVRMGKRERQMAEALYDDLPKEQAWQKWANGPGKRAALKSAGRK